MGLGQAASSGRLDADRVRAMFDRIAGVYDLMNTAMTAGLHHRWRERAAEMAGVAPGSRVLDVATGTGDLALELARRVSPTGQVVASDFSEAMLDRARAKADKRPAEEVHPRFEWADAMALPYPDDSFDSATVGFGARNFDDLAKGLSEMVRVVRPGGRVVVLEITTPTRAPLSLFYRVWFDRLVPLLGRLAGAVAALATRLGRPTSGGSIGDAYTYLPSSVRRFPGPPALAAEMEQAGLSDVRYLITAGGIVAIHAGTVRSERA
ncbi:MAG: ubiquinone/menaquinone biosynthesis methyltransferase [Solirubrobacterales bacterium]|nr:ubiquinone/menaquinone biosynthesis methyltransferase [Solirubrobacterales bacterium]MCW3025367.1 ubiquinone/menaquinone biosynthesis methyltransferase [Solirubrobacterales bacterium]